MMVGDMIAYLNKMSIKLKIMYQENGGMPLKN